MDDLEFRKFVHDILNCLAIAHGKVRVVTRKVERDEANKEYLINELKKMESALTRAIETTNAKRESQRVVSERKAG